MSLQATDNVAVASVTFYVDDTYVGAVVASPYAIPLSTGTCSNGTHVIKAVALDSVNNASSSLATVTVSNGIADTVAPTIAIIAPTSNSSVSNNLSVTASASDNVAVVKVELYVDGKLVSTDTPCPYAFSVSTKMWVAGSHTLQCKAYDAASNVGVSSVVSVTK